ncbi:MAG TPA: DUF389 domain-containing protein, partial [Chitinophagaceae bacterium]|nr:DUF389 domain-containing protein [Chitinophagaceae bacterium]
MGIGLGMAINDIPLLRRALANFGVATLVALATSTVFFLLSPINDAHSEILARTSPNIYDVLIALFGGLAGTLATGSRNKGNVIPGVAIATALMPPLCTAGYGLATLQFPFFFGAFYLFIINTVFIALGTLLMCRFLHFHVKDFASETERKKAKYAAWFIVMITLLPSIYFGYDLVRKGRYLKQADNFIINEAVFPNDYLLKKEIDPATQKITLVFGGREITEPEISELKSRLSKYKLKGTELEVRQGFAYMDKKKGEGDEKERVMATALTKEAREADSLRKALSLIKEEKQNARQIFSELKIQYPGLKEAIIQPVVPVNDSGSKKELLVMLEINGMLKAAEKTKLENWLKVRLNSEKVRLVLR